MLRKLTEGQRRTIAHWAMEFVVVVVGVLLALWLQELVGERDEQRKLAAAEAAIHSELDDNLIILIAHTAVDRCLSDRIREIESHIRNSGPTPAITGHALSLPRAAKSGSRVGIVYAFFDVRVQDAAWQGAQASGVLAGQDRTKFTKLAEIYGEYRMVDEALSQATDAGTELQVLGLWHRPSARPTSPALHGDDPSFP